MKLLTLTYTLVLALFFTSPPHEHDCDELDTHAEHADHCQLCLIATASSAVLEESYSTLPVYDIVGHAAGASQPGHPRIQSKQHRNRAPPLP